MKNNKNVLYVSLSIALIIIVYLFRSIVSNIDSQLYDWNDYPLLLWIVDQHIDHLLSGDIHNIFQSNILYPFRDSLLFSDLLLPQSLITFIYLLLVNNLIIAFNLTFFTTWLLNTYAAWFTWKKIWQGYPLLLATIFTSFMPFLIINTAHFQMLGIWPFLFGFSFLLHKKITYKQAFYLGAWLSITFLSSVYLAIFLMYCVVLWCFVNIRLNIKGLTSWLKWFSIFTTVIIFLVGPVAYKYFQVKNAYQVERSFGEYVQYSAGLLDYLSSASYHSVFTELRMVKRWNSLIPTSAGSFFPTFTLLILASFSFTLIKKKKPPILGVAFANTKESTFMLLLLLSGFIFSLGPRLKIGSLYVGPPLPYELLLKTVPIFSPVRANARWYLLFCLGLIYFAIQGFRKIEVDRLVQKYKFIKVALVCVVLSVYFLESLPVHRKFFPPNTSQKIERHIISICSANTILLEYPMLYNPYGDARGIIQMLQHWTGILLDATAHNCLVVNGYSGFFPKDYDRYQQELTDSMNSAQKEKIINLLQQRNVDLLRIHLEKLTATESAMIKELVDKKHLEIVHTDENENIYQVIGTSSQH